MSALGDRLGLVRARCPCCRAVSIRKVDHITVTGWTNSVSTTFRCTSCGWSAALEPEVPVVMNIVLEWVREANRRAGRAT